MNEDQRLSIAAPGLLANDSGPDGDTLAVAPGFSFPDHAAGFGLSADGSFEYAPTANYNGTDSFVYQARDGATDSNLAPVTIAVSPINDTPGFDLGEDQTVTNTSGAQTVERFATNISAGPPNESGQALTFTVTSDDDSLFSAQPDIDETTGDLTYTPNGNASGTATVSVELKDDGGTANGGDDTSDTKTFTITVNPVNDAPSFTKGADPTRSWRFSRLPGPPFGRTPSG